MNYWLVADKQLRADLFCSILYFVIEANMTIIEANKMTHLFP